MNRSRRLCFLGFIVCIMIFIFAVPASAATLKKISKVKYGQRAYYAKSSLITTDSGYKYKTFNLVSKMNGKIKVIQKDLFRYTVDEKPALYADSKTMYFTTSMAKFCSLSLETGKVKVIRDFLKEDSRVSIGSAYGQYLYIHVGKHRWVYNTNTKKFKKLSGSIGYSPLLVYKGYVYDIGHFKDLGSGEPVMLNRYQADGKRISSKSTSGDIGFCDIKPYKGALYVTKYNYKNSKYRVYKTNLSLTRMTPVTKWVKKVPKKYYTPRGLFF